MLKLRRLAILFLLLPVFGTVFVTAQCSSAQETEAKKEEPKKEEPKKEEEKKEEMKKEEAKKEEDPVARKRSLDLGQEVLDRLNGRLAQMSLSDYDPYAVEVKKTQFDELINRIKPVLKEALDQVPEGYVLEVKGHANPNKQHGEDYWLDLSNKRARRVYDHLVEQGITADKMAVKGVGSSEPAQSGWSPKNRRVTFKVIKK